jgi:hypothetical protein
MIEYYNYLTTPSGKSFNIKEIKNSEYLVLLKFLNGENYKGFYLALDSLLKESIPDFDELNLCDKAYIYIAYYFYSIRASIVVQGTKVDSVEVPLTILLDSLETNYVKEETEFEIKSWKAKIHYPKYLIFDDNDKIAIDKFSSLQAIAGNKLTEKSQLENLRAAMPTKYINEIEYQVDKHYNSKVTICNYGPNSKEITDELMSPSLFYSIAFIYKDLLDNFYNMQYLVTHYIRVDWTSLLNMTPIELNILYKNFIEDKEKQNEKNSSKNSGLNIGDPNISDSLMPY